MANIVKKDDNLLPALMREVEDKWLHYMVWRQER